MEHGVGMLDESLAKFLTRTNYYWLSAAGDMVFALQQSLAPEKVPQMLMVTVNDLLEEFAMRQMASAIGQSAGVGPNSNWETLSLLLFGVVDKANYPDIEEESVRGSLMSLGEKSLCSVRELVNEFVSHGRMMQNLVWLLAIYNFQASAGPYEPSDL